MEIAKKALVSCELAGGRMKTEIKGGLEDVLSLTTYLLVSAATRHHQGRNHRPGRAKRNYHGRVRSRY